MNDQKIKKISMENAQINEHIKSYFKFNGFQNSLECFESEINAQRMSSKLQSSKIVVKDPEQQADAPKLYQLLKQDSYKSKRERNTEDQLKVVNQKYLQLLEVSRNLFKISIQMAQEYQQLSNSLQDNEAAAQKIKLYQQHTLQYRRLLFQGSEVTAEYIKPSNAEIRNLKNRIIDSANEKNEKNCLDAIVEFRVKALNTKTEDREELCSIFIKEDVLDLIGLNRDNQPQNYILQLLTWTNFEIKQQLLSLVSYYLSYSHGVQDFLGKDKSLAILQEILHFMSQVDFDSVSYRFCLAILQKCALSSEVILLLNKEDLQNRLLDQLIQQSKQQQKATLFTIEYISAILCNILQSSSTIQSYSQKQEQAKEFMKKLLESLSPAYTVDVNMNLLFCLSKFKNQQFSQQQIEVLFDEKINNFLDSVSESRDDYYTTELVTYHQQIFLMEQNQKAIDLEKAQEKRMLKESEKMATQAILFEHFVDEISSKILQ